MLRTIGLVGLIVVFTSLISDQSQAQFTNGSFETGDFTGWVTQDLDGPFFPLGVAPAGAANSFGWPWSNTPTDGQFDAYHGWDGDGASGSASTIRIAQDVLVTGPMLSFDHRAAWDTTFGATIDRQFDVNIEVFGGGANLQSTSILTAAAGTMQFDTGALTSIVDVSAFLGNTVRVSFDWTVPEDFTGPAAASLDNVQFVPEPGSMMLICIGSAMLVTRRRR